MVKIKNKDNQHRYRRIYRNKHRYLSSKGIIKEIELQMKSKGKYNHPEKAEGNPRSGPQQAFLKNFQNIKDHLIEDNHTNVKNLNLANHNFNQIFSYLKGIIRKVLMKNERLELRIRDLQSELAKKDPNNRVLLRFQDGPLNFGEAGHKLSTFVPLVPKYADSLTSKFIAPTTFQQKKATSLKRKMNSHEDTLKQMNQIENFISQQLGRNLIQDPLKKFTIPKSIILNLYLKWSEINQRKIHVSKISIVKAMLTNEIKRMFPNIDHNERDYCGITFRQDLLQGARKEGEAVLPNADVTRNNEQVDAMYNEILFLDGFDSDSNLNLDLSDKF